MRTMYNVFYIGRRRRRQSLPPPHADIAYARPVWSDEYLIPVGPDWLMGTRDEALMRVGILNKQTRKASP